MALQVNVRELVCCDEPDQCGSVRAIPDFKVCSLGPLESRLQSAFRSLL